MAGQVFYLSARRYEIALWERATGRSPHHIDLASVRFGHVDAAPDDFVLPEIETLPLPERRSPENYATELGVPPVDPCRPAGTIHLFHLLRDDLRLLHHLMEEWRTNTLGQLEGLLRSTAAAAAIPDENMRKRLGGRCATGRTWIAAWRQGRGKPVDRITLESSDAVSNTFIDRVAQLAESLGGDAVALIGALEEGEVSRFRSNSTEELAEWLASEGYIDPDETLNPEERERRTLMDAANRTTSDDIRQVVRWLEAGQQGT